MSNPRTETETAHRKHQLYNAEYDKLMFEMMDIIDNAEMKDCDYLSMCNTLKKLRQSVLQQQGQAYVERTRRDRVRRYITNRDKEEMMRKNIKEKKYECDSCGSLFVSERNVEHHKETTMKCSQIVCERVWTDATKRVMEKDKKDTLDGNKIVNKNKLLAKYDRNFIKHLIITYNGNKIKARREMSNIDRKEEKYKEVKKWCVNHIRHYFKGTKEYPTNL